jgi:hypothetical protein
MLFCDRVLPIPMEKPAGESAIPRASSRSPKKKDIDPGE